MDKPGAGQGTSLYTYAKRTLQIAAMNLCKYYLTKGTTIYPIKYTSGWRHFVSCVSIRLLPEKHEVQLPNQT